MTFTFQLSFWEQYRASVAVSRRTPNDRLKWIAFPLIGVLFLLGGVSPSANGGLARSAYFIGFGMLNIAVMPATPAFEVWRVRRKNSLWAGPHTFTIGNDGIHVTSPQMDETLPWSAVTRFVRTRSFLLFFVAPRLAFYLPKRVMSPQDLRAVLELAVARIDAD